MPVKVVGPERMLSWQPKGQSKRNSLGAPREPEYGLGPQGMVGSVGYNQANLSPQAQKWERMGLYWTGRGVAQGRPLAEIEQGIGLAGRQDDRAERQFGQTVINQDRNFGLNERQFTESKSNNLLNYGLASRAEDRAMAAQSDASKIAAGRLDVDRINAMSALTPESQPEAAGLIGLAAPKTPLVSALTPKQQISPIPEGVTDAQISAVREGLSVDPNSPTADKEFAGIARRNKLAKGFDAAAYTTRKLVESLGPAVKADQDRRMPPAKGGAPDASADLVEAYFTKYGGKYTREEIAAKLRNQAQ